MGSTSAKTGLIAGQTCDVENLINKKYIMRKALFLIILLLTSSCGTIAARVSKENMPPVTIYPATAADGFGFYLLCCTDFIHMEGKQPLGTTIALRTIFPALMLLDAPISLATDTALLPYDIYRWNTKAKALPDRGDAPGEK
ncbi:YceK/YidQ family lipoprotein [Geotalea sp. SG265]|uniref:YceK/YidQ family lipoprotein n=1 Tax=Geotalea sp. SG265 TaxID=2922867 RepID=UPI001FAEFBC1|nr:YceK/YidQ family lipoprotein [Geotalea sp. SG265]